SSFLSLLQRPPTTHIYPLSLHDALPISFRIARPAEAEALALFDEANQLDRVGKAALDGLELGLPPRRIAAQRQDIVDARAVRLIDRKSTRLNSSHLGISYAVFCLKKKKK